MYRVYGGFVTTFTPDFGIEKNLRNKTKNLEGKKKKMKEKITFLSKQLHNHSMAFTLCHIRGQQVPSLIKSSS